MLTTQEQLLVVAISLATAPEHSFGWSQAHLDAIVARVRASLDDDHFASFERAVSVLAKPRDSGSNADRRRRMATRIAAAAVAGRSVEVVMQRDERTLRRRIEIQALSAASVDDWQLHTTEGDSLLVSEIFSLAVREPTGTVCNDSTQRPHAS
ncbi:MAG: hypothetical protein AAF266_10955 [Planctomycetota bacterium]